MKILIKVGLWKSWVIATGFLSFIVEAFHYASSELCWSKGSWLVTTSLSWRLFHLTPALNRLVKLNKGRGGVWGDGCIEQSHRTLRLLFYSGIIEQNITSWFSNSCVQDRKALQRMICAAPCCCRSALPSVQDIYNKRCRTRAVSVFKASSHTMQ